MPTSVLAQQPVEAADTFFALGADFYVGNERSAAEAIVARARSSAGGYGCFCSVHVLIEGQHDERVRRALDEAWTVFPDGVPIAWLGRRAGVKEADRVCGIDVLPLVADLGRAYALRHFLFGSTPETLAALERRLRAAYPGVAIVGTLSPRMAPLDQIELLEETERIRAADPDIVWCGLGAPKQELWMRRFAGELSPAVVLGVGAAFDLVGGTKPRAPYWMQRRGLEWLYRLASEPRRLGGRYVRTNTEFLLRVVRDLVRSETAGRSTS